MPVRQGEHYVPAELDEAAAATALAEATAHFASVPAGRNEEAVELLASLLACGISPAQLKAYTAGTDTVRAASAALAAIGAGDLKLTLPAPRRREFDDVTMPLLEELPGEASFLCSSCGRSFPQAQTHVVPTFEPTRQAYVGSYRCDQHWKAALDETRNVFLERAGTDLQFESGALLAFLVGRGISRDVLRRHTTAKMPVDAVMAVLDELEAGRLSLSV